MKIFPSVKFVLIGISLVSVCLGSLAAPVVSNVRAEQRHGTGLVEIYFDLTGTGDAAAVMVQCSDNSGTNYSLSMSSLTGDLGPNVALGRNRMIVWDALKDSPQVQSESMRIKITATKGLNLKMVEIPRGNFEMGDPFGEFNQSELPVHMVNLDAFLIGETKVTWSQWLEIRDWAIANGYWDLVGRGQRKGVDHPVYELNWYEAVKWCNAASEKFGLEPVYLLEEGGAVYRRGEVTPFIEYRNSGYRLPTEAEWERAARGGLEGKRFPWGDTISHDEANYLANGNEFIYDTSNYLDWTYHPDYEQVWPPFTSPVKNFQPNAYGLYDTAGNLKEWCGDWFKNTYYSVSALTNPLGPDSGLEKVRRGGNWGSGADYCRVAHRGHSPPNDRSYSVGFRVSRSLSGSPGAMNAESTQSSSESSDFSLFTVAGSLSGTFTNGSVIGLGQYLKKSTVTLTAVPDPGFIFEEWDASLINALVAVPLQSSSMVSVVDYNGNDYYTLNGIKTYGEKRHYLLEEGKYSLTHIPYSAPLAIVNGGKKSAFNYEVVNSSPIKIFIKGGNQTFPYYTFTDEEGNDLTMLFQSGYSLMRGRTYLFIADGISSSYPFMINSSRFNAKESWVLGNPLTGSGSTLEVKLPKDYLGTVQFYSPLYSNMNGFFNLSLVLIDGYHYDAYWGSVFVTVTDDFGSIDVRSGNSSVLGGDALFAYNNSHFISVYMNPINILIDGDKRITATFIEDTTDADSDGLTAYEEQVVFKTDPNLADTDGDGHSDFVELINFSSDALNSKSVPSYLLNVETSISTTVTGQITYGDIDLISDESKGRKDHQLEVEINTLAEINLQIPNEFVLVGWVGDYIGIENPIILSIDSEKFIGAEIISLSNYSRIEQLGLTEGYNEGLKDGILQGEELVLSDPEKYDLLNTGMVSNGLSLGGMRIQDADGKKLISFNIESSKDLKSWTLEERIERQVLVPDGDPIFMRVSVPTDDF